MNKTLCRRLTALFMVIAVVLSMMPAMTLTANAASKKKKSNKVQMVMQEKDYEGNSVKYSYNKKGLIAKKVVKRTSKGESYDTVTTDTTTYKYNKKNRIATETLKSVENEKTYDVSKTTGKSNGKVLGNVTTTTTKVTKYTYNKKGAATKSVTTSTAVKSGSVTETSQSLLIEDDGAIQVGDKYLAGYNERKADGSYNDKNTSANAYYYTGAINEAVYNSTEKTTYKDNGNGTYTVTVEETTKPANYSTKVNEKYYKEDAEGKIIAGTEDDYDFSVVESVDVVLNTDGSSETISKTERVVKDSSVATRVYKNDKKKRAVKATVTVQETTNESVKDSETSNRKYTEDDDYYYDKDGNEVSVKSSTEKKNIESSSSTIENTNKYSFVETYKYDKKGHRKQIVYDNKGVTDSREVVTDGPSSVTYESVTTYSDGKVSKTNETSTSEGGSITETVTSGGNEKVTVTYVPHKIVSSDNYVYPSGREQNDDATTSYTYYGNGVVKTVTESTEKDKSPSGEVDTETRTATRYDYDEVESKYSNVVTGKYTYADGSSSDISDSTYYDGKDTYYDFAVDDEYDTEEDKAQKAKIRAEVDALNKAAEASGMNSSKTETTPVKANPIKETTKCTYDKSGNLKAATTTRNWTVVEYLKNETYGNTVYQYDAEGKVEAVEVQVSHKSTTSKAKENTLKKGTKRASTSTTVSKVAEDRSTPSYSTGERVTYKLKAKKINKKLLKDVELQQWMIQNPNCSGVIGL